MGWSTHIYWSLLRNHMGWFTHIYWSLLKNHMGWSTHIYRSLLWNHIGWSTHIYWSLLWDHMGWSTHIYWSLLWNHLKNSHLLFTCFILIFYRRDNRFECLNRAIQNNRLCQPISIRRVWRYQRVIIIRTSKNRQHNGQKNRRHNGQQKKVQKDKQRSTEHTYKTKDRETRAPGQSSDLKRSYVIYIRIEMMHRRNKSCDILTLVTLFSLYLSRAIARV